MQTTWLVRLALYWNGSQQKRHTSTCRSWDMAILLNTSCLSAETSCIQIKNLGQKAHQASGASICDLMTTKWIQFHEEKVDVQDPSYLGTFKVFRSIKSYCFMV